MHVLTALLKYINLLREIWMSVSFPDYLYGIINPCIVFYHNYLNPTNNPYGGNNCSVRSYIAYNKMNKIFETKFWKTQSNNFL